MVSDARRIIGRAIETVQGREREQICRGTMAGDMPDPQFRFNVQFVEHREPFPMHAHEYAELVFVLGGSALHRTDGEDFPINLGDVFVIKGAERHGFGDPRRLKLCNVMFDPESFFAGERDLECLMGFHALFDLEPQSRGGRGFRSRLRLSASELAELQPLLVRMRTELEQRAEGWRTLIRGHFLVLVSALARLYAQQSQNAQAPIVNMANVVSHIQRTFRGPLRIEELAKIAHLSPSQFRRNFKRTYQVTPVQFINELRVHEACELLRRPQAEIKRIAAETGFASSSFFATQFKRITGLSPSEYRRRHVSGLSEREPVGGNGFRQPRLSPAAVAGQKRQTR
ncbi:HTH-type transcriptional activator RhaR [Planctomycetes bacterium Pan216]|uniref:HTH-type transcriptional activator RhaR n=2 Tax=Kolteria novifilia TaxID=2527975 RepID=A0A518B029_9BACT|nr:HTH-type transcriptional activator RhaR [Planctomycetes bacterium Pan216]